MIFEHYFVKSHGMWDKSKHPLCILLRQQNAKLACWCWLQVWTALGIHQMDLKGPGEELQPKIFELNCKADCASSFAFFCRWNLLLGEMFSILVFLLFNLGNIVVTKLVNCWHKKKAPSRRGPKALQNGTFSAASEGSSWDWLSVYLSSYITQAVVEPQKASI